MPQPNGTPLRSKPRLLVVDDDRDLCHLVTQYLEPEGFTVSAAHNGNEGAKQGIEGDYELIVLDVMLPDKKGFDVLRDIRERVKTPVLMLTAKGDEFDRILGLELGADDYLPKPFNPRELIARISAILRRSGWQSESGAASRPPVIISGDIELDLGARSVSRSGEMLKVTLQNSICCTARRRLPAFRKEVAMIPTDNFSFSTDSTRMCCHVRWMTRHFELHMQPRAANSSYFEAISQRLGISLLRGVPTSCCSS
jgi:DNA-binding response OmpR family regulator